MTTLTDAELVTAARLGDTAALAALLERHRAGMHATALAVLGWTPETEDVVQDAMLTALARLGDLREPAAAGAWLRALARNGARMRARTAGRETPTGLPDGTVPAREPTPDELLEGHALRDWVRTAVDALSEPLQTAVLLRYFTQVNTYAQIAALCDVPVGTVRSRLSEARRKLAGGLAAATDGRHEDAAAVTARRRREADFLLGAAARGGFPDALAELSAPEVVLTAAAGFAAEGRDMLVRIMDTDLEAGVRQSVANVVAGRGVAIWECDLHSPPWDPEHCPPGVVWLMQVRDDRIRRIRLFHPAPGSWRSASVGAPARHDQRAGDERAAFG
jgi:RNA polymerase sigma-70 factor (ECF subfamily)